MGIKTFAAVGVVAGASIVGLELALRAVWGAGDPLLLRADPRVGYYFAANQDVTRRGNSMHINAHHQRSPNVSRTTPARTTRLLMVGDSVTFGGTYVDQAETISADLERLLQVKADEAYQVLNASAGSWGIGNQLAYLREFGTFDSDLVVLQIGSHDLLQAKSSGDKVGNNPAMPNEKPWSAIGETMALKVLPKITSVIADEPEAPQSQRELAAIFRENLNHFEQAINFIRKNEASVLVLHTPDKVEVAVSDEPSDDVGYRPYRRRFLRKAEELGVAVIDLSHEWRGAPEVAQWFRDGVHLTAGGNEAAAHALVRKIRILKLL